MSAKIDPVGVANRIMGHPMIFGYSIKPSEILALAKVVIAAATVIDTLPSSYDPHDDLVVRHAKALNALAAVLKGE